MSAIGLGRKPSQDPQNTRQRYLLAQVPTPVTAKTWVSPGALDQGSTAQCVAYSGIKYLTSSPVMNHPKETPEGIYRECLRVDEWAGEDMEGGTSVMALFKVLHRLGYVAEYKWAFDVETVVNHVLTRGPVCMGTSWYRDMSMPNATHGYITATGRDDGGHAWLIIGANRKRKNPDGSIGAVRMVNSWGPRWGPSGNGRAWITLHDLAKLIKNDGEACVATELKISALKTEGAFA